MQLTPILVGFLNRVFNKDPQKFVALKIAYPGPLTWAIADQVLTTMPGSDAGAPLSIDLTQYTIGTLAAFIAAETGYEVTFSDSVRASLSASVLIDGVGDLSAAGGDTLYGYQSLLWRILDAAAQALQPAENSVALAPSMMQTTTATGSWLDVIGARFGVPRNYQETDAQYGPRIPATVLRPASNNFAIGNMLEDYIGYQCDVNDGGVGDPPFTFDGAYNFDGSQNYTSAVPNLYGVFDIVVHTGDPLSGQAFAALSAQIRALVTIVRAGGTRLRNITQTT